MGGPFAYRVCIGPRGQCSADCCLDNAERVVDDAVVSCAVRSGGEGLYRLTFSAYNTAEDTGIAGEELQGQLEEQTRQRHKHKLRELLED